LKKLENQEMVDLQNELKKWYKWNPDCRRKSI
jgi:hypothetical protein